MSGGDKKHFGRGHQGKGDGTGAMTEIDKDKVGDNEVLSNRDKAQHNQQRGLDGKHVQTEQYHDHVDNRLKDDDEKP